MTSSPAIRPYRSEDREALDDICIRTAHNGQDSRPVYADPTIFPTIFAAPYVVLEPELAFVLDDGRGRAVGYILGTADTPRFVEAFRIDLHQSHSIAWSDHRVEFTNLDNLPFCPQADLEVIGRLQIRGEPCGTIEVRERAGQNGDAGFDVIESEVGGEHRAGRVIRLKGPYAGPANCRDYAVHADVGSYVDERVFRPQKGTDKGKLRFVVPNRHPRTGEVTPWGAP